MMWISERGVKQSGREGGREVEGKEKGAVR